MNMSANNESKVKLSIIIPVYNAEDYLKEGLDSVLGQSLSEIEVICVDDGSTDKSLEILKGYAEGDRRLKVLTQENKYAGMARNNGLMHARGEYVHFLDADDKVLPFAYEALYNKVKKYDLDMIRCASLSWNMERGVFEDNPLNSLSRLNPGDFNRICGTEDGSPLYSISVTPWSGLYRRSFLLENNILFDDLVCCNDRSFYAACYTNSKRTMISRDRLVFHRTGQSGSLMGRRARNYSCVIRSVEIIAERLKKDGIDLDVQERVLNAEFRSLMVWFRKFSVIPETGDEIREQTEIFIRGYRGAFAGLLKKRYVETLKQIKKVQEEKLYNEVRPIHEACERPRVTVVVPVCNAEDYLNESLHSLTVQRLEEMEFVCVDDGSTDGSLTILKEYAAIDKRFRILDGPNGGYGKAMNMGIEAAAGEYLGILEPDDFVPSEMFSELYTKATDNQAELVKANFYSFTIGNNGTVVLKRCEPGADRSIYNRVLCPVEEPDAYRFVINALSGIYRLDFLRKWNIHYNETSEGSYQDKGFEFQAFCRAERAFFAEKAYYRKRRDNKDPFISDPEKMYAMAGEYRFILDWLEKEPEIFEKVKKLYYTKKLSDLLDTLYLLKPELQPEYVKHLYKEFNEINYRELIYRDYIGEGSWIRFNDIMDGPDAWTDHIYVSVIIPVYNSEKWLEQTLDSMLVRNEIPFELICVDDGSTDGSQDILRRYEKRDKRVRVITQENAGTGAARNAGMELARGEYLLFPDLNDFFDPGILRTAYDRAKDADADITVFRCDRFREDTGEFTSMNYTIRNELLPEDVFSGADIAVNVFGAFVGWAWDKLFRTDFVRKIKLKFQEQRTTNDMFFVFSAIVKAERITVMDDVLVHHRSGEEPSAAAGEENWGCFYYTLCKLRGQLADWELYDMREQDFINYSLHSCLWNLTQMQGQSFHTLYNKLKEEWFENLGITSHSMDYFYNRGEWEQYERIMALSSEEYLFWHASDVKEKADRQLAGMVSRAKYNSLNNKLNQTYAEKNTLSRRLGQVYAEKREINSRLQQTYAEKSEINRKLQITYREKAERGIRIKELEAELRAAKSNPVSYITMGMHRVARKVFRNLKK